MEPDACISRTSRLVIRNPERTKKIWTPRCPRPSDLLSSAGTCRDLESARWLMHTSPMATARMPSSDGRFLDVDTYGLSRFLTPPQKWGRDLGQWHAWL